MILLLSGLAFSFGMVLSLPSPAQSLISFCTLSALIIYELILSFRNNTNSHLLLAKICLLPSLLLLEWAKDGSFIFLMLRDLSLYASSLVGALLGRPLALGLSYSGIELLLLFLLAGLWLLAFYKVRLRPLLYYSLGCLALWFVYIGLWSLLAENSLSFGLNYLEPLTGPLDYRLILLAFLLLALRYFSSHILGKGQERELGFLGSFKLAKALPAIYLLILLLVLYTGSAKLALPQGNLNRTESSASQQEGTQSGSSTIVFWDTHTDFSLPAYGRYGLDDVGMFGVLPRYLSLRGHECLKVSNLEASALKGAAVLVIINPLRLPTENEIVAVDAFVSGGGTVVMAGDHTCRDAIREPINKLLEAVNVELNFDSAVGFKSLWGGRYEKQGGLTEGLLDRHIQIVVGASISIDASSTPIVKALEGYTDAGDILNEADGYLGDMRFNPGEQLGDLILASETRRGLGRYVLFGDTSLFQNSVLPYSYPLIDRLFLGAKRAAEGAAAIDFQEGLSSLCLINGTKIEKISRDKSSDSIDGFLVNLMRAGIFPMVNYTSSLTEVLEADEKIELVVFMEPAKPLTMEELKALEAFMHRGGRVLVCADYMSPRAAKELVRYFGFTFMSMPIGRVAPDRDESMAFWSACPLLFEGENPQKVEFEGVRSLMSVWDYSVMAEKSIGEGAFLLFADGDFLKNKNLEHIDSYREGNINFLRKIIEGGE